MKTIFLIVVVVLLALCSDVQSSRADMPSAGELHLIKAKFYIAASGGDTNEGTSERPFRTLDRAQRAVRELKLVPDPKGNWQYVIVYIRGNLDLENRTTFTPDDSAPDHTTICYASENEDEVAMLIGPSRQYFNGSSQDISYLLSELLRIQGTLAKPVRGIEFHRIGWCFSKGGYLMYEADLPDPPGGKFKLTTKNDFIQAGPVTVYFARDIQFQDCEFKTNNGPGVSFGVGSQDCYVNRCKFYDNRWYSIVIGDKQIREPANVNPEAKKKNSDTPHVETDPAIPSRIQVKRCLFDNGGGIFIGSANHTWTRQNVFRDLDTAAIEIGSSARDKATVCGNHLISENNIYRVCNQINAAAVMVRGKQSGTIIRQNLIHDIQSEERKRDKEFRPRPTRKDTKTHAISLIGASDVMIENNTIYNTPQSPILIGTQGKNTFKNNRIVSKSGSPAFEYPPKLVKPDDTQKIDNVEITSDKPWQIPSDDPAINAGYKKYNEPVQPNEQTDSK